MLHHSVLVAPCLCTELWGKGQESQTVLALPLTVVRQLSAFALPSYSCTQAAKSGIKVLRCGNMPCAGLKPLV